MPRSIVHAATLPRIGRRGGWPGAHRGHGRPAVVVEPPAPTPPTPAHQHRVRGRSQRAPSRTAHPTRRERCSGSLETVPGVGQWIAGEAGQKEANERVRTEEQNTGQNTGAEKQAHEQQSRRGRPPAHASGGLSESPSLWRPQRSECPFALPLRFPQQGLNRRPYMQPLCQLWRCGICRWNSWTYDGEMDFVVPVWSGKRGK